MTISRALAWPLRVRHSADWRAIASLDVYRFTIGFGLVAVLSSGAMTRWFAPELPEVFRFGCLVYLVQCTCALAAALMRWPSRPVHVLIVSGVDVVFFTGLAAAGQGVGGGLSTLLIPPLAAAGLLLPARSSALLAACGVLGLLGQEAWRASYGVTDAADFVEAGILGMLYFMSALLAAWLARRVQTSEALAADRASQARDLAELNRRIIERMQAGAVVVDAADDVRLINAAAIALLGDESRSIDYPVPLRVLAPALAEALAEWRRNRAHGAPAILRIGDRALIPTFAELGDTRSTALIFLEDAARQDEQAQQLKLVSIGRLTASIAHEIRNPLSAISHAGQLLAEAPTLGRDEQRLLAIVHRHSQRIDAIVNRVLGLSRRPAGQVQSIRLASWLTALIDDYRRGQAAPPEFDDAGVARHVEVVFDPEHLRQVICNIWDNACRHARRDDRSLTIGIQTNTDSEGNVDLEIADNGPGIDPSYETRILEPFFTTAREGTGLGLHIARELCAANHAVLMLAACSSGACFRIVFQRRSRLYREPSVYSLDAHDPITTARGPVRPNR